MTAANAHAPASADIRRSSLMPTALRLALRELRSGLGGFYVFIACMALGVGVITAVGALGDALRAGLETQGQAILGGDITLSRMHTRATAAERAFIDGLGRSSETATMRSMARRLDGSDQALIELKGVDSAYPLAGKIVMRGQQDLSQALSAAGSAVVDPLLLERLRLKVGDKFRLGNIEAKITGVVEREPDLISDRVSYGSRVLVSTETLMRTGLVQPGTLLRWRYAARLPEADAASLTALRARIASELPEAGFLVADRRDPSPRVTRTLERLRQFLTLIGITSLLIGGVGVANAVATFIDRRRKVIATMKSIGASGRMVFGIFFAQVMLISAFGIAIGLVLGYLAPLILTSFYGTALPVPAVISISPLSIAMAVAYGVLVAALFTLWPLGRAERIRAGVLFREEVAPVRIWPRWQIIVLILCALAAIVALAIFSSDTRLTAIWFLGAVAGVFVVFAALGWLVSWLARRSPRPRSAAWRLALGSIGAPDGLTRSVVLSLGAGLSLLVAVALTDASLTAELTTRVPKTSPAYYALDIARADREKFTAAVRAEAPEARIDEAPMLRGRIVRLNGQRTDDMKVGPNAQWVLNGDRGLTYAETLPEGSTITQGEWWPKDYAGEPLLSFEDELAKGLGLKVGDTVTVNVLGRNVTARIANLREVKWESLSINFVMVFSPNTLRGAPHNLLATVVLPEANDAAALAKEARIARAVARDLPTVTMIRVKEAIAAFQAIFEKVMAAVRVAGGVTLLAGALVLGGALATAQRRRIKQAVIMKTLGATRGRILATHLIEYSLLALVTAVFAAILGTITAWIAVTWLMEFEFEFSLLAVFQALGVALALVLAFGLIGTWAVLRAPPVPALRAE